MKRLLVLLVACVTAGFAAALLVFPANRAVTVVSGGGAPSVASPALATPSPLLFTAPAVPAVPPAPLSGTPGCPPLDNAGRGGGGGSVFCPGGGGVVPGSSVPPS